MKIRIFLLLFLSIHFSNAQLLLRQQDSFELLHIENLSDHSWKTLSSITPGKLVGYYLKNDTLEAYFDNNGKLYSLKFADSSTFEMHGPDCNVWMEDSLIKAAPSYPASSPSDEQLIHSKVPYYALRPYLSPDRKAILYEVQRWVMFNSWKKIYEVDINSGQETFISKGYDAHYSPDGNFILFKDYIHNYYQLYDRRQGKKLRFQQSAAYWIYKN